MVLLTYHFARDSCLELPKQFFPCESVVSKNIWNGLVSIVHTSVTKRPLALQPSSLAMFFYKKEKHKQRNLER